MIGRKKKKEQKTARYKDLIEKEFLGELEEGETAELYTLEKELDNVELYAYHRAQIILKKALNKNDDKDENYGRKRK